MISFKFQNMYNFGMIVYTKMTREPEQYIPHANLQREVQQRLLPGTQACDWKYEITQYKYHMVLKKIRDKKNPT